MVDRVSQVGHLGLHLAALASGALGLRTAGRSCVRGSSSGSHVGDLSGEDDGGAGPGLHLLVTRCSLSGP